MMPFFLVFFFFLLLFLLFFLSQKISSSFFSFFFFLTGNKKLSLGLLLFFLLPGTIVHELSHFLFATLLRVPTGELSIFPSLEKEGKVQAGKLVLGKTDPLRLSLIGLAPIIIGLSIIYFLGKLFLSDFFLLLTKSQEVNIFLFFAVFYLLFAISSTMFSSRKDLESLLVALPVIFLLVIFLQFIKVQIFWEKRLMEKLNEILSELNYFLLLIVIFDYFLFFLFRFTLFFWKKIKEKKMFG